RVVTELLPVGQAHVGAHRTESDDVTVLTAATRERDPQTAVEQTIPVVDRARIGVVESAYFKRIDLAEQQGRERLALQVLRDEARQVRPDDTAALAMTLVAPVRD